MNPLRRKENECIFDYCLGLTGAEQVGPVKMLLAHNGWAADLCARLQAALGPLRCVRLKRCPEALAERTIRLLCGAVRTKTMYS